VERDNADEREKERREKKEIEIHKERERKEKKRCLEWQQWRIKLCDQIQAGKFVGLKGSLEDENLHDPFLINPSLKVSKLFFSYYFLLLLSPSSLSFLFSLFSLSFSLSPSNPKC